MILDPQTGHLLDLGHHAYRPSAALARFVKTRDRTCSFPGCNRAAHHGDLDHARPYRPNDPDGGRTDPDNLHPPCKNHHVLKHKGHWVLRTNPATRQHYWTSPAGHQYPIIPVDHRPEPAPVIEEPAETPPAKDVSDVCPF